MRINSIIDFIKSERNSRRICLDVKNFFENENEISDILNKSRNGENHIFQGFLVNKEWVDKWKKYSNYDDIKNNLLLKNINDEIEIKNFIIKQQSQNCIDYDDIIIGIENYILSNVKNKKQIIEYPSINQYYVILSGKFLRSFINNYNVDPTEFILSHQTISIRFLGGHYLYFKANSNIISNRNIINSVPQNNRMTEKRIYYSQKLKHLIRYPFFKQELISPVNSLKKQS